MSRLCPLYSKYPVNVLYTYTGINPTQECYFFRKPLVTLQVLYEIISIGAVTRSRYVTLCQKMPW